MLRTPQQLRTHSRRGSLIPAVAVAIVVFGSGVALVINQAWLSMAHAELQGAVESAAMAAARQLANDDLLRMDVDPEERVERIRSIASQVAFDHQVAGTSAFVSSEPYVDTRFGRPVTSPLTGQVTFIETNDFPTTVLVTGHRDRQAGNPVRLPFSLLTGIPVGDVTYRAEASVSNHIAGLRPFHDANIPAWPIAILDHSESDQLASWSEHELAGFPSDDYGWDAELKRVTNEPDGIGEIVVTTSSTTTARNVCLVDLSGSLTDENLVRQIETGWSASDLDALGGEIRFNELPIGLEALNSVPESIFLSLESQIGMSRIVILYLPENETSSTSIESVQVTRCVAVRLMDLYRIGDQTTFIFQPTVVATRMGVLNDETTSAFYNDYIFRIAVTQ